jgi:predicted O-methyltransferase YrrM
MGDIDYRTALGACLTLKEREWLKGAAERVSARFADREQVVFVNVGVEYGASCHCLRAGSPDALLVGVDLDFSHLEDVEALGDDGLYLPLEGDSTEICHDFLGLPIHLLFIDGGHDYRTVSCDIAGWIPKLAPGGIVAFHDYYDMHNGQAPWIRGVKRAVDEWMHLKGWGEDWEIVAHVDSVQAFRRRQ